MEMILGMASDLLITVVMGLLVLLFAWVKKYLVEKISLIQGEQERKIATAALSRADNIAELIVKKMQQTFVADTKKAAEDGKLSADEIMAIKDKTASELATLINPQLRYDLKATVGDVDLYLKNLVEAKVLDLKKWENVLEFDEIEKAHSEEADEEETEASVI